MEKRSLEDVVNLRDNLYLEQEKLYLGMVNQINSQMKDLLTVDLGAELAKNCLQEISAQIVARYIPVSQKGNKFITAREMYNRIVNFSYDDDYDPLYANNQEIREMMYQNTDHEFMAIVAEESKNSQEALFPKINPDPKKSYRDDYPIIDKGIDRYKENQRAQNDGKLIDELTGYEENINKNNNRSDIHADHVQSVKAATYNSDYIRADKLEEYREFYNSADNFQLMHASANSSKGDVRVIDPKTGDDITYKATPEQFTDAIIDRWENGFKNKAQKGVPLREKLHATGYAEKIEDKNGNVTYKIKKEVREKLYKNVKKSMNAESMVVLKTADYGAIGKRALKNTAKSFFDILSGQLIYYGLPPVVHETKIIIQNKNSDVDSFFEKIAKAFKKIISYMHSKLKDIMSNIAHQSFRTFVMSFFDILIGLLKATVKRIMTMIREVVMALVNSIKILRDKNRTAAEKADAVFTTLGITISSVVVNILIEYAEKVCPWIKPFTDPLQIIITVITTNLVMIILQKMDIFNVRYGLMMNKIQEIFEKEKEEYRAKLKELEDTTYANIDSMIEEIEGNIFDTITNFSSLNIYEDDFKDEIDNINKIFNMGIDLDAEWSHFASV